MFFHQNLSAANLIKVLLPVYDSYAKFDAKVTLFALKERKRVNSQQQAVE